MDEVTATRSDECEQGHQQIAQTRLHRSSLRSFDGWRAPGVLPLLPVGRLVNLTPCAPFSATPLRGREMPRPLHLTITRHCSIM